MSTTSGIAQHAMVTSVAIAAVQLVSSCGKSSAQNAEIRWILITPLGDASALSLLSVFANISKASSGGAAA